MGRDPSALIFEDYLTGLNNRRFLLHYLKHNIDWNHLDQQPVSLMMVDIDHFKRINTQYGHAVGDQVLIHIAGIIKSVSREKAIPGLYAGDVFLLLLPGKTKENAVKLAAELFYQINSNVFFSPDAGAVIPLTVSIGIATAPAEAATSDELMEQAHNALFHAKQTGRNRYADAGMVTRQAVHYLENAGIVGRKSQFDQISMALKKFAEGQNQMIIIDGGPGMGKTSFLSTIHRNLEKTKLNTLRVSGIPQESFRPYYLASQIAIKLMNQREDKGIGILDSMNENELGFLSQVIPQLDVSPIQMPKDEEQYRNAIFRSFAKFFIALIGKHPLIVLVDDLHYCDPASLHLFHFIVRSNVIRFFLCGTASEEKLTKAKSLPLELFRTAYGQELNILSITLTPLTVDDIGKFLNMTFPGIDMPMRLIRELTDLTQGNPLFMMEILRKMISDQKIMQSGRQWKMARLDKKYFPKSLEEIVMHKMDLLDDESKRFLECAAAFGESISLSMLTGSYNEKSSKIHDFVSRGVAQGIVRSNFEENDENIIFASKSIREAIYGAMDPDHKKNLHEEIGVYHEKLYKQDLLPSASPLAYHFKRSDDVQKAAVYSKLQEEYEKKIFNAREAAQYSLDDTSEPEASFKSGIEELGEIPLNREGLALIPKLFRAFLVAVRNIRLYPIDSKSVENALDHAQILTQQILVHVERLSIITEKQNILINSQLLEAKDFIPIAEKIIELWDRIQLKSLTFCRGFSETEFKDILEIISRIEPKDITLDFWKRLIENKGFKYIFPRQIQYTKKHKSSDRTPGDGLNLNLDLTLQTTADFETPGKQLDETGLKAIQKVISSLLGAYSKLKLYPDNNPVATEAINQLMTELHQYFPMQPELTLAMVEKTLLVNGVKVDTTGFETPARGLRRFFADTQLNSITFLKTVSFRDLMEFMTACIQVPPGDSESFWRQRMNDNIMGGVLLNQKIYAVIEAQAGTARDLPKPDLEQKPKEPDISDSDLENFPQRLREFFLTGNITGAQSLLDQVCHQYVTLDDSRKKTILNAFSSALQAQDWNPGAAFMKLALTPLLPLIETEKNKELLHQASDLIQHCTSAFVLFGEYGLATWAYGALKKISAQIHPRPVDAPEHLSFSDKTMDPKILTCVMEDLKSEDRHRQQEAYQLLGSMGPMAVPALIDLIKREDNLRARQLAAELVKSSGRSGVDLLKKIFMGENRPDERARILDVMDMVTRDVMPELTDALSDNRDLVRRAAFRLAERLHTPEVVQLLLEFSQSSDTHLASHAISTAAKLKPGAVKETILKILKTSHATDVLAAACRAMGQTADPSAIPALTKILTQRRFLGGKKYDSQIRVAAAWALSQIPGDKSQKALAIASHDPDPKVRETVKQAMGNQR